MKSLVVVVVLFLLCFKGAHQKCLDLFTSIVENRGVHVVGRTKIACNTCVIQCQTKIPQSIIRELQYQSTVMDALRRELKTTKHGVKNVSVMRKMWPMGFYCILANGKCPPGFTPRSGYLKGINTIGSHSLYIYPVQFGSSSIQCYDKKCTSSRGNLIINACCK